MKDIEIKQEEIEQEEDIQFAENIENGNADQESPSVSYQQKREQLKQTKIVKQTWSIQEIYQKISKKKLNLSPDYQRNNIWDINKKTAFIESLFMGILIPPIYVVEIPGNNRLEESTYEVVDGKQRLTTLNGFLNNDFALRKKTLDYYGDYFGDKKFIDIYIDDYKDLINEMLSSVLDVYVITANSPEFTKYDIFSRLNKGAEKLRVDEIRKAIYRSEVISYIEEFIENKLEKEAERYNAIFTKTSQKRYNDFGRFYRSIAFYQKSNTETCVVEKYNSRPRDMINDVLSDFQNKKITIDNNVLFKILELTLLLKEKLKETDNDDYIIDSCIPFVIGNSNVMDKINEIIADDAILESLEISPGTTSNVNKRLARVKQIMEE